MALIRNITSSWSDAVTLSTDEVWQARKGAVLLSTQASPGAQDGIGLAAGKALRFASGTQLRYRKDGAGAAMIAREAVGGGLMAAIGTVPPLLFLVAGQSNAIGRAAFDGGDPHPADTVQWTSAGGERAASVPLEHAGAQAGEMGLDLSFAAAVRAAHPEAKIVFIPVAAGETGFADNRWNPGDDLFNAAVAEANAAIAQYDVGGLSGILWQQGARDAATLADASLYQARLEAMVLALRAAITGSNDTPFLVGEIGAFLDPSTYPGRDAVIAAQNGLAANITRAATVPTGDLTAFDGVHFDAASLRVLGTRYHAALAVAEAHTPAPVISGVPGISGVIGVGNTVTAIPADVRPKPSVTSWRWVLDGIPIPDATGASYTIQPGDAHGALTVRQIETGIGGTHAVTSLAGAVGAGIAAPPGQVQGLAVMPGDGLNDLAWSVPVQGSAAIADYLIEVSVDGAPYAPLADGVSTATSFTHAGLSNGTAYTYRVSAVNAAGTGAASAPRTGTPLPALAAPENRIAPAIGGTFETGQTLSVTEGGWIGNPAFTLTYQWVRDGVDIAGATSSTYTIVAADAGSVVGCTVTASNSEGAASVPATGEGPVTGPVGFDPADLFASGERGVWYQPSPDTCFTDLAGTTPASVGDAVARMNDLSGNDAHATQATAAARPILRQEATGEHHLEFDGVDDFMTFPVNLSSSRWTVALAYVPDGSNVLLLHRDGSLNYWAGVAVSGSSSTLRGDRTAPVSLHFDNAQSLSTTRDQLYQDYQAANSVIYEFTSQSGFASEAAFGGYFGDPSIGLPGPTYGMVLIERSVTPAERADLQTCFEGLLP